MRKIIAATGNQGKVREIKEIFSDFEVLSYKDIDVKIEVEENENTFEGNALKKAKTGAEILGELCLADDSGIMIEYFDGWPGVRTARWMQGTDHERNLAIIDKMKDVPKNKRKVKYITAIAISDKKFSMVSTHTIEGYISENPRGENGFGFDEIFELEDGRTLAELKPEEKNTISARKKALEKAKEKMRKNVL
jgi:XTP/dITP diphosphohydrolase